MREQQLEPNQTTLPRPELLASVQSAFPLMLFPDSIDIDRRKITIIHRAFLNKSTVVSVSLTDIHRVELSTGPLLGSLKIWAKFFDDRPLTVRSLTKGDAFLIKRLLDGYIIAIERHIDCTIVPKDELITMLMGLGQGVDNWR
jgi:hypothetical protein